MSEQLPNSDGLDLTYVADSDVRRALRSMHQNLMAAIAKQQLEIDAMLEMIMEKHMGTLGEFKRHLVRLQQNGARGDRIHTAVESASHVPPAPPPRPVAPGMHNPMV